MYQRIYGCDWRNIWLVGDLHGCFARLMAALRERKFDPYQDLLLSVGDLIDRGPQSAECLDLLRYRWIYCAIAGFTRCVETMNRWRWRRLPTAI